MKKKIEDALKTEFKELGLGDKTIGRLAEYIIAKGTVTNEEDIATAVKGDDVKLIAKSIQGEIDGIQKAKKKAEDDLADYKAKHPEGDGSGDKGGDKGEGEGEGKQQPDFAKAVAEAVAAAVNPLKEAFETYKSEHSAREAKETAKTTFFGNKWTTKFKEEADDAWDRASELNDAKGGGMTAEELSTKATEYFKKLVQRKGADIDKPFEAEEGKDGKYDFSSVSKHLEETGKLTPEGKN